MGDQLIKDIPTEGDLFGNLCLTGNSGTDEYAEALTGNTILSSMHVTDFKKALYDAPFMALNYANKVSNKLRKPEGRHADLVFKDAKTRLIHFIKDWAHTNGNRIGNRIG